MVDLTVFSHMTYTAQKALRGYCRDLGIKTTEQLIDAANMTDSSARKAYARIPICVATACAYALVVEQKAIERGFRYRTGMYGKWRTKPEELRDSIELCGYKDFEDFRVRCPEISRQVLQKLWDGEQTTICSCEAVDQLCDALDVYPEDIMVKKMPRNAKHIQQSERNRKDESERRKKDEKSKKKAR